MMVLDCESRESTLESISKCYKIPIDEIDVFLTTTNIDNYYNGNKPHLSPEKVIIHSFEKHFSQIRYFPSKIYWFHSTRTYKGNRFNRGILPLSESLDIIWDIIMTVFRGTNHYNKLVKLRTMEDFDFQYSLKTNNNLFGGPYGILVKDEAFRFEELGSHDYLKSPEIMEDICTGFLNKFKQDIQPQLIESLSPCIVKFWTKAHCEKSVVESAIYYLYLTAREEGLDDFTNAPFDGKNTTIPPNQIDKIEYVQL